MWKTRGSEYLDSGKSMVKISKKYAERALSESGNFKQTNN